MRRITATLKLLRGIIQRHGGGLTGVRVVAVRSFRIVRAIGWKALLQRIHASRQDALPTVNATDPVAFPIASPLAQVHLKIGVMVHAFYADLLDEVAEHLANMPTPYVLMVSVPDEDALADASRRFASLPNVQLLHVRVVPNRGRDIAPFLLDFRDEILALDLVCHIHTKKSLYAGSEQDRWRHYLFKSLLGSRDRVGWILGTFHAMPRLGMVYPETFPAAPWWAHTWLSNVDVASRLGSMLGIGIDPLAYIDYPVGSMFWARTEALRPLFALNLSLSDFPPEEGQNDGTTQHAIEHLFGQVVLQHAFVLGITAPDGAQSMKSEGDRNWAAYFRAPLHQRINFAAVDAQCVSFDLFDTLLTRPFLQPSGARAYLADLVERTFGVVRFAALRTQSERIARSVTEKDVNLADIYAAMAKLPEMRGHDVSAMHELELVTETRLLRARRTMLDAATALVASGKRVVAVSDMYLNEADLRRVLPCPVSGTLQAIHVSCATGWRKDSGEAWRELPAKEGIAPAHWLHIGDNERADVQLPLACGYIGPVHVLRPDSLLDVVPALRPLRPSRELLSRWQDQLWLGLIANRFADLADRNPQAFGATITIESPETFGYLVLGPLLLDFSTWLARLAHQGTQRQILFLSREGYLLSQAFRRVQASDPSTADIATHYLLASRRATNTPTLRVIEDLLPIFEAPYTGPLDTMLRARLGDRVTSVVVRQLGAGAGHGEIYLPEMATKLVDHIRPIAPEILRIAGDERDAYLAYWQSVRMSSCGAMVVDIGYAATIQSRLTAMTGTPLQGAYLAVRREAANASGDQVFARYHDGRSSSHTTPVMQHHLLLESVLTSPEGQFSHFENDATGLAARYVANALAPTAWQTIEHIHSGALQFVDDVRSVTGTETGQVAFDSLHVQQPLHCVATGLWRLGAWARDLNVEDQYTGRGDVQVAT